MWEDSQYVDILALTRGVDMSDASSSSRNKRSLLPVGRVHTEDWSMVSVGIIKYYISDIISKRGAGIVIYCAADAESKTTKEGARLPH